MNDVVPSSNRLEIGASFFRARLHSPLVLVRWRAKTTIIADACTVLKFRVTTVQCYKIRLLLLLLTFIHYICTFAEKKIDYRITDLNHSQIKSRPYLK